ncbi:MAG: hypothetical protein ACJAVD_000478 [Porticoccaceae bacterium]|jgi:hypothetical protein
MSFLKKITALVVFSITIFSFVKKESNSPEIKLNLEEINVITILSKQKYECRPSSKFMFYVETNLLKKSRGSNTINASIFVLDRATGYASLLANENILVPLYKEVISVEYSSLISDREKGVLNNGDKIIGSSKNTLYCFNELIKFGVISRSYTKSRNRLLNVKSL